MWSRSQHQRCVRYGEVSCNSCHKPYTPVSALTQGPPQNTHLHGIGQAQEAAQHIHSGVIGEKVLVWGFVSPARPPLPQTPPPPTQTSFTCECMRVFDV